MTIRQLSDLLLRSILQRGGLCGPLSCQWLLQRRLRLRMPPSRMARRTSKSLTRISLSGLGPSTDPRVTRAPARAAVSLAALRERMHPTRAFVLVRIVGTMRVSRCGSRRAAAARRGLSRHTTATDERPTVRHGGGDAGQQRRRHCAPWLCALTWRYLARRARTWRRVLPRALRCNDGVVGRVGESRPYAHKKRGGGGG